MRYSVPVTNEEGLQDETQWWLDIGQATLANTFYDKITHDATME